jgi:hypothetical protein
VLHKRSDIQPQRWGAHARAHAALPRRRAAVRAISSAAVTRRNPWKSAGVPTNALKLMSDTYAKRRVCPTHDALQHGCAEHVGVSSRSCSAHASMVSVRYMRSMRTRAAQQRAPLPLATGGKHAERGLAGDRRSSRAAAETSACIPPQPPECASTWRMQRAQQHPRTRSQTVAAPALVRRSHRLRKAPVLQAECGRRHVMHKSVCIHWRRALLPSPACDRALCTACIAPSTQYRTIYTSQLVHRALHSLFSCLEREP